MKIAVLGSGAAGNVIGGLLAQAGEQVTLIDANEPHVATVRSQGLWIDSPNGRMHVSPAAQTKMTERPDICLLNTPVHEIVPTLHESQQFLENVPVVTLQNNPRAAELAASVLGKQYILSVVVLFGAKLSPGHVSCPVSGPLLIGEPFDSTGFAESLVAMFNHVLPTTYVDNIHGAQWTKLITSLHHSLAAATGLRAEEVAEHPQLRPVAAAIMKEATDITQSAGIQLNSLPDLPPVNKIISVLNLPPPASELIPRLLGRVQREMVVAANIVAEIKREGQLAIAHINGEVIELGKQVNVVATHNAAVIKIVEQAVANNQQLAPEKIAAAMDTEIEGPTDFQSNVVKLHPPAQKD